MMMIVIVNGRRSVVVMVTVNSGMDSYDDDGGNY